MRVHPLNAIGALLLAFALWLVATQALGQIVNASFNFVDKKEPDTNGVGNFTGNTNQGIGRTTCRDGANTVFIQGLSTHAQLVKLKMGSAELKQGAKNNKPNIRFVGSGALVFNVLTTCDMASLQTKIKVAPPPGVGSFQVNARNCTGLTEAQAVYVQDICAADTENKTVKVTVDGSTVKSLKLRGKGPVVVPM